MTEYYQEQPEELPETLPDDIRARHLGGALLRGAKREGEHYSFSSWKLPDCEWEQYAGMVQASGIDWESVPRQPAPTFQPEPGQLCAGLYEGVEFRGTYSHTTSDGWAVLSSPGSGYHLVTRESLRPVATPSADPVARRKAGETDDELRERKSAAARKPKLQPVADPYRAHRMSNPYEVSSMFGPSASSRLDQGIAAAARRQSAKEGMNAPMVKRKRVQFIEPYPAHLRWPNGEDDD